MKQKILISQKSVTTPQSRLKWSLLGVLILALPFTWFVLALIWSMIYGQLFNPPQPNYYFFSVIIGPLLLLPFTLVLGILVIIFAKRDIPKIIRFREVALWSIVALTVVSFALFIVFSFSSEGGRTPFNRPNYGITSTQAKVEIQQAYNVLVSSGHLSWANGRPNLEKLQLTSDWCTRWIYDSSVIDDPTTDLGQSSVFNSVSSALKNIGWKTEIGVLDDKSGPYVYASKNNASTNNSASVELDSDSEASQLNNTMNAMRVEITSACFID